MSAETRFQDNVRAIEKALEERNGLRRRNNGAELYHLCKELVRHSKVRIAAPLSMQLIEEACERYRRDNFEAQLAAVAEEMSNG